MPKRYNTLEDKVIHAFANEEFMLAKKEENGVQVLELEEEKCNVSEVHGKFEEFNKVFNHCYLIDRFRRAFHNSCNLFFL